MSDKTNPLQTDQTARVIIARIACVCLGSTFVLLGASPAIVERIVTGQPPSVAVLSSGISAFVIGCGFLWLQTQFQRARWALSIATISGLLLMFVGLVYAWTAESARIAISPMFLAAFVTFSAWAAQAGPISGPDLRTGSSAPQSPDADRPPGDDR